MRIKRAALLVAVKLILPSAALSQADPTYYKLRIVPIPAPGSPTFPEYEAPSDLPSGEPLLYPHPYHTKCWNHTPTDVSDNGTITFTQGGKGYVAVPCGHHDLCEKQVLAQENSLCDPQSPFCLSNPEHDCCLGDPPFYSRACSISDDELFITGSHAWYRHATDSTAAIWMNGSSISLYHADLPPHTGTFLAARRFRSTYAFGGIRDDRAELLRLQSNGSLARTIMPNDFNLLATHSIRQDRTYGWQQVGIAYDDAEARPWGGFFSWLYHLGVFQTDFIQSRVLHDFLPTETGNPFFVGCTSDDGDMPNAFFGTATRTSTHIPSCLFSINEHRVAVGVDGDIASETPWDAKAFIWSDLGSVLDLNGHLAGRRMTDASEISPHLHIQSAHAISNKGHIAVSVVDTLEEERYYGLLTPAAIPLTATAVPGAVKIGEAFTVEVLLDNIPPISQGPNGPIGLQPFIGMDTSLFESLPGNEFLSNSQTQTLEFKALPNPDLKTPTEREIIIELAGVKATARVTLLPLETCDDGIDNDGDGWIDCMDPDCSMRPCDGESSFCIHGSCERFEVICWDGLDDDGDGYTDCEDPDCDGRLCDTEKSGLCLYGQCTPYELDCANGIDDDQDGHTDCEDWDCNFESCNYEKEGFVCVSGSCVQFEVHCADGIDDDMDGFIDCEDPDCAGVPCSANGGICWHGQCVQPESDCSNGVDDDLDGLIDCEEATCDGMPCHLSGSVCTGSRCKETVSTTTATGWSIVRIRSTVLPERSASSTTPIRTPPTGSTSSASQAVPADEAPS